ncbi:MAG: cytochrome c-type biogenesis protein [Pseudomonadales bacterium]|nr:cytochrome c-type biogenesis protein [Pseudomonadales bacterium]
MRFMLLVLLTVLYFPITTLVSPAMAAVDVYEFETDEQQQRFRRLSDEFRCPMCQNTSLTGSTGGVAEDLRREIYRMIVAGETDQQIEQFMFERYGDFIFYRPRLTLETVLLWFGPLLFLIIGGIVIVRIARSSRSSNEEDAQALPPEEQERLRDLLKKMGN